MSSRVISRVLIAVLIGVLVSTSMAQSGVAPGRAATQAAARSWSQAEILDMFGPAAPKRQVHWGSVIRYTGVIISGATWVYAALNHLYGTLEAGASDMYLESEFGSGKGDTVMSVAGFRDAYQPEVPASRFRSTRGMSDGSTQSAVVPGRSVGEAQGEAMAFHGATRFVLSGWQSVSVAECPINSIPPRYAVTTCLVQYGHIPLATRMQHQRDTGNWLGGSPMAPIQTATDRYVDDHPLSDEVVGIYPGMSWETAAPNINQWTDSVVNPGLDSDGDGYSDGREIDAGTDPSDAESYPGGSPDVSRPRPVPPVDVAPAPVPDLPDAPTRPVVAPGTDPDRPAPSEEPGSPAPAPDPDDNPTESDPATEEAEDTSTECWPLACERTLVQLQNLATQGNVISGDMRAELDYQTDMLWAQYHQLEYQSEVALEGMRQAEYQITLTELQLERADIAIDIAEAELEEAEYQRSLHLAILEQLQYESDTLVDQFALLGHMASVQSSLLAEQERSTFLQEEMLEELRRDSEDVMPETFGPLNVVLPNWSPGQITSEMFAGVGTAMETAIGGAITEAQGKLPFLTSGWIPVVSLGGGGSCEGIQMQILGSPQEVGVCDSPVHTVLATTVRTALLALMVIGFWIGMARWVSTS